MIEPSETLLQYLPRIERIVAGVCRRRGISTAESEDFSGDFRLRLIQNDYAIIRAFSGRSSFETYISAVATRALMDYQVHRWGKWNPSAMAKRLGSLAVELEQLIYRHHQPVDEAFAVLRAKHPEVTRAALEELVATLPPRMRRREVALESVDLAHGPEVSAAENADTAVRISETLRDAIRRLPSEDRLLLQLRFEAEMSMTQIAQALQLPPHQLYQRLTRRLHTLRKELEAAGIDAHDVLEIIGSSAAVLDFDLDRFAEDKSTEGKPS